MLLDSLLVVLLLAAVGLLAWLAAALRKLQARVDELLARQAPAPPIRQAETQKAASDGFGSFEAWLFLRDRLDLRQGIPYSRWWSAAPDFLKLIAEHTLEHRPESILECGAGATTLVLVRCCEINGAGRVLSLEDGPEFAAKIRCEMDRYGLQGRAEVQHAPLEAVRLDEADYQWYPRPELADRSIDLLVIDGPSGFIQPWSRFPALPLLREKLADGCWIFLDDAARPDEQALTARWLELMPELEMQYLENDRGCAILRWRA